MSILCCVLIYTVYGIRVYQQYTVYIISDDIYSILTTMSYQYTGWYIIFMILVLLLYITLLYFHIFSLARSQHVNSLTQEKYISSIQFFIFWQLDE